MKYITITIFLLIALSRINAQTLCNGKECPVDQYCHKTAEVCVSNKQGTCPAQELTIQAQSNCKNDGDCKKDLKCCSFNNSTYCTKPCRKMMCKCPADSKVEYVNDVKGCPVCRCVSKESETPTNDSICDLPIKVGVCKASITRYFYNKETNKCETFSYGGCMGNENNFKTLQACESKCSTKKAKISDKSFCSLQSEMGPCRAMLPRFFFNKDTQKCEKFFYGGCMGNKNNFVTLEECENNCSSSSTKISTELDKSFCSLKSEKGPCKAMLQRFYFNNDTQTCEQFYYGGCMGNKNNFILKDDCLTTCSVQTEKRMIIDQTCTQEKKVGKCRGYFLRYFYNSASKQCEEFIYGGCDGNDNNFETLEACTQKCSAKEEPSAKLKSNLCALEPQAGGCRGYFERYFYNATSKQCESFIYGGCNGNENNFETIENCLDSCSSVSKRVLQEGNKQCSLPAESGPCFAYFEKYFYNTTSKKCEQFVYGGCMGNENRFDTEELCQNACVPPKIETNKNICALEKRAGSCRGYFQRYFFNSSTNKCEEFIYGGCDGNDNNFETLDKCHQTCSSNSAAAKDSVVKTEKKELDKSVCSLKSEIGPCKAMLPRFFYNTETQKCEEFFYGGCMGNQNNFETVEECNNLCSSIPDTESKSQKISSQNICALEKRAGSCRGYFQRYFFNSSTNKCEEFIYGGCDGNDNNFETLDKCHQTCDSSQVKKNEISSEIDICNQEKKVGGCRGYFERFFYNNTLNECQKFIYGGCDANENNFETLNECKTKCNKEIETKLKKSAEVCLLPQDMGPCRGRLTRFFFNKSTEKCEEFVYGGCMGNENNFESIDECTSKCS